VNQRIFRPAALERLSSPEQLDQLITAPPLYAWAALLAVSLILIAAFVWSLTATVPTQVSGQGIFLRGGQTIQVAAPVAGQVAAMVIREGDDVQAGQVVATVRSMSSSGSSLVDVTAASAGRVIELLSGAGSVVAAGDSLALLEDTSRPLQVVAYLAPADAARVAPGLRAEVLPAAGTDQLPGAWQGTVAAVADYPATQASLLHVLGSDLLAAQFSAGGAPVQVTIDLSEGVRAAGPLPTVGSGALCSVVITVAEHHPIDWLLP
jgi:multidrug efflux pump subunit AcrA (membrane-fusion protein)